MCLKQLIVRFNPTTSIFTLVKDDLGFIKIQEVEMRPLVKKNDQIGKRNVISRLCK